MYSAEQLINKLNELISYCNEHRATYERLGESLVVSGDFENMLYDVKDQIQRYYSNIPNQMSIELIKTITALNSDIILRNTTYEFNYGDPPSTNFPQGYFDFRLILNCGTTWDEIMTISNTDFLAGFPIVEDVELDQNGELKPMDDPTYHYAKNPIISTWMLSNNEDLHANEIDRMIAIQEFCESNGWQDGLISTFEERGITTIHNTKYERAHDIYIDRGLKSIINEFNLNVYIPSYI